MDSERSSWTGPAVYYDGQSAVEREVVCMITPAGIALRGGGNFDFPKGVVRTSLQGMDDYARLELPTPPGGVVLVRNREAVQALRRTGQLLLPLWRRRLQSPRTVVALLGLAAVVVLLFIHGLDLLAGAAVRFVPADVEVALGRRILQAYLLEHPPAEAPHAQAVLAKCANALEDSGGTGGIPLDILLVDDTTPNAFALPGGGIVVFTGLVDKMEDESELLGVLAHEMGHVRLRHGLRRVARTAWLGFFVSATLGDVSGLTAVLLDNSKLLVSLSYDRKEERAADAFALRTLRDSGIDTRGLAALFERLEAEGTTGSLPGFLSTHPPTAERLQALLETQSPRVAERRVLTPEEWDVLKNAQ